MNSHAEVTNLNADLLDGLHAELTAAAGHEGLLRRARHRRVNSDGSVACTTSSQFPISGVLTSGNFTDQFLESTMSLQLHCRAVNGFVGVDFISQTDTDATLNWMFSEGGTTSTVNANGTDHRAPTVHGLQPPRDPPRGPVHLERTRCRSSPSA